ncbi:cytochrome c-552 class I [Neoasaia chiangmaiensis NBRC 101099]|uniref:Uncharacterized protein n=2 Tax=Neoasaia chiangmaiensis TaxID=320497 RepID=A0A1U9KMB3_9PROT|nr:cytochrome c [Neoasaia chiangmaiensis]AQS86870.1 hypothetical protein A0U93_01675 [Neoasaia chiangmaiensis]GBR37437.1 cytochrome c-552 class I [Neoasaia chiangmaiensis NBRC 101099]GEN14952.1 hypothetical protein NCH01_13830 [Neoasaia chiangmaiensis]
MTRFFILVAMATGISSAFAATDGRSVYDGNCSACHQNDASGSPGQYPQLKGRVDKIAGSADGRTYLAHVLLNGLHGSIEAAGNNYAGLMPSFNSLSDDQIAAVLTYVSALGDTKPAPDFTADDIRELRATHKKNKDILAERHALESAHAIP